MGEDDITLNVNTLQKVLPSQDALNVSTALKLPLPQTDVGKGPSTWSNVGGIVREVFLGIKVHRRCRDSRFDACAGRGMLRDLLNAPAHARNDG